MSDCTAGDVQRSRRELGARLRQGRLAKQWSGEELALKTEFSQAKISRIETGRVSPRPRDVKRLSRALGLPRELAEELTSEAQRIADINQNLRRARSEGGIGRLQGEHQAAEALHTQFRTFSMGLVPGLLQVPAYSRSVIQSALPSLGTNDLTAGVVKRVERQSILDDVGRQFTFVLDPTSIYFRYGRPEEHLVQLQHLRAVAHRPNVTLRAFSHERPPPVPVFHSFTLFDESRVVIELIHAELFVADPEDILHYRRWFDRLLDGALNEHETLELIDALIQRQQGGGLSGNHIVESG